MSKLTRRVLLTLTFPFIGTAFGYSLATFISLLVNITDFDGLAITFIIFSVAASVAAAVGYLANTEMR